MHMGKRWNFISVHLQNDRSLLGPQARWYRETGLQAPLNECRYHLEGRMMFQKGKNHDRKGSYPDPTSQNFSADVVLFCQHCGIEQAQWGKTVPQITWTCAIKNFTGDNQHLELYPETNWQPIPLLQDGWYMWKSRLAQNQAGWYFLNQILYRFLLCTTEGAMWWKLNILSMCMCVFLRESNMKKDEWIMLYKCSRKNICLQKWIYNPS